MRLELKTQHVLHQEHDGTHLAIFYDAYIRYRGPDGAYIYVLPLFRYPGMSRTMYEN